MALCSTGLRSMVDSGLQVSANALMLVAISALAWAWAVAARN